MIAHTGGDDCLSTDSSMFGAETAGAWLLLFDTCGDESARLWRSGRRARAGSC